MDPVSSVAAGSADEFAAFGAVTIEPLSRLQFLAGAALACNWAGIPHVTHHDDVDVTELERHRSALNAARPNRKLTLLPFIIKAMVAAMESHPRFNASLDPTGRALVLKHYFHIGVAIDTPKGLLVGVVRDCDHKSIDEIGAAVDTLSSRARGRGLPLEEMSGGCMTVSSLGGIGGTGFTPIINAPEVAILGVTRGVWKPRRGPGDVADWRLMLPLSLSYDHRVLNGADAARFVCHVGQALAQQATPDPAADPTLPG